MVMKFGAVIIATDPPNEFIKVVEMCEDLGFDTIWDTDASLHARDAYPYLTLLALHTTRARIGVNVSHPFTRHPAVTANAIATVDEIAQGRTILGVGAGDRPQTELGQRPARVAELREMVELIRRLLRREKITHDGPTFRVKEGQLRSGFTSEIPIYMAASGPRMLELAGEVADGVIMQVGIAPEGVDYALSHLRRGAEKAGRSMADLELCLILNCCIYRDRARAIREGRLHAAWYPQTAPKATEAIGVSKEQADRIRAAYSGGHLNEAQDAAELVPESLVQKFVLAGAPEEVREMIHRVAEKGIQQIQIFALGPDRHQILRTFGETVIPHFR